MKTYNIILAIAVVLTIAWLILLTAQMKSCASDYYDQVSVTAPLLAQQANAKDNAEATLGLLYFLWLIVIGIFWAFYAWLRSEEEQ
jgi:FlaG/FlaF family flagellin (archaellin)